MPEAYIIDAVRTPVGRRGKGLAGVHPLDLAAAPLRELVARQDIDSAEYDEVILGCIDQLGPQAMDVARNAWLAAGLSEDVPGTTVERQCGSGQQAVHYAAQAVMSGTADLVVAGGVQNANAYEAIGVHCRVRCIDVPFGWKIGGSKRIVGGSSGYVGGNDRRALNTPPSKGVSSGPGNSASHSR